MSDQLTFELDTPFAAPKINETWPKAVGDYEFGDKVRILGMTAGFIPHSKEEATVALQVQPHASVDAARYIDEVFQKTIKEYPESKAQSAARAVAHNIIGYHIDAANLTSCLAENVAVLDSIDNPELSLDHVACGGISAVGLLTVVRDVEVQRVAALPGNGRLQLMRIHRKGVSGGSQDIDAALALLSVMKIADSVGVVRTLTRQARDSQSKRAAFWLPAIHDMRRHAIARPLAMDYLEQQTQTAA
jgi:hypothetical protein